MRRSALLSSSLVTKRDNYKGCVLLLFLPPPLNVRSAMS
jgi:hypothetical protein